MESAQIPAGTPAPYGRTCMNCSRAKCKCILLTTGTGCERCQRLNKECRPAQTVRKRNKQPSGSNTAHLEAKLDWIMSEFERRGVPPGLPDWQPANLGQSSRNNPSQSAPTTQSPPSVSSLSATEEGQCPAQFLPSYDKEILSLIYVPPAMAQKCLDHFRTRNLQYLPFVYIPDSMTSDQLRHQYPFLWVCIMEVTTFNNPEKGDSFGRITNHIHQRVMLDLVPSMDLLLGIMTFVSWVSYTKRPFLNIYAHILMAVVAELGINGTNDYSAMSSFKDAIGMKQAPPAARTMEERRAVLGCYLISSSAALAISRIDAMRWTPHMEESLSILTEAKECPQDELLVALVKVHLVLDRVYQLRRDGAVFISLPFYLDSFKNQLDTVKGQISPHLQHHRVILLFLYNAEIIINELSIGTPAISHSPDPHRLDSLYTTLRATKGWLDVWIEFEAEEYLQLSCIIFFQFTRGIVSLYRLTVLEDPAWSQSMVRDTANILEYLNKNEAIIRRCPEYITFDHSREMNLLEKGLRMIQGMRMNWEPKLSEMWRSDMPGDNGINSGMIQSDAVLPDVMPVDEIDEAWMMDFLGSL
ncbi:hypothetical protein ACN38_g137 [Penicillium nordicum]|uniref:Zn(2)-C6 fungal-type domain-containing protein n=1 Tax=Penicillium nordicum TaxID=229535 RepID=A0A0M9WL03_9EURO|nr:hypothetical protein ACN38_g137 [Penicillium nordicum]